MSLPVDARREMLFGPPNQPSVTSNASNEYAKEFNIDPFARAYAGTNTRIQNIIIQKITDAELFMTRILLPVAPAPADGQITVSTLQFHEHEFAEVPETGTVRLTTSSFTSWKQGMQRRGLGFMMEDGYAVTALGVMTYFASIAQITNAATEAMVLNGYRALLDTDVPSPADHGWMRAAGLDLVQDVVDVFKERIEMFAIVNKPAGITRLADKVRVMMKKRGVTVDAMIVPFGIRDMIKANYNSNAIYNFVSGARNMQMPDFMGMISDMRVFESNMYTYDAGDGKGEMKNDPLVRNSAIGEKFSLSYDRVMGQYSSEIAKYKRNAFTATVFDHDNNRRGSIRLMDMFRACGLFDKSGYPSEPMGRTFFSGAGNNIRDYLKNAGGSALRDALNVIAAKTNLVWPANPDAKEFKGHKVAATAGHRFGAMDDSDDDDSSFARQSKPAFENNIITLYVTDSNKDLVLDQRAAAEVTKELKGTDSDGVWGKMAERGASTFNAAEVRSFLQSFPAGFPTNLQKTLQYMYRTRAAQRALYGEFKTANGMDVATPRRFLTRLYDGMPYEITTGSVHITRRADYMKDPVSAKWETGPEMASLNGFAPGFAPSMHQWVAVNHKADVTSIDGILTDINEFLYHSTATNADQKSVELIKSGLRVATSAGTEDAAYNALKIVITNKALMKADASVENAKKFDAAMHNYQFADPQVSADAESKLAALPITRSSFEWMIDHDIPIGMGFSLRRPFIQYRTGTIIFLVAGSETGQTFFSGADFQLGNDVYRKVIHGNFTCKTGTVIKERKNVMVVHDAVCLDYLYGGGNKLFDHTDISITTKFDEGQLDKCPSIFVVPLYPTEEDGDIFGDLTGRMPASSKPGETSMPSPPQFAMADAFSSMWSLHHAAPYFQTTAPRAPTSAINTALAQGQLHYPKIGPNGFDEMGNMVSSGGHWSDEHTFDGCMPMRCGKAGGLPTATVIKTIVTK